MISLYKPALKELNFRQRLLADEETMSYNHAWGGTIDFPESRWEKWYGLWLAGDERMRFYRYLQLKATGEFAGEAAYHFDNERGIYLADVIVYSPYRGMGIGGRALELLCAAAKNNGIETLYDEIAADNPSLKFFVKRGFEAVKTTAETVLVRKEL